jgi:cysteinyl-tRNA synthetase
MGIRPIELRYYLLESHYRSRIDYTDESLREKAVALRRIEGFVQRAVERVGPVPAGELPAGFVAAMDDDLNTSASLASLREVVHHGNTALDADDEAAIRAALAAVRAMLDVLGIDPLDPAWGAGGSDHLREVVDSLVALALDQRAQARARRDWTAADAVRDQLKQAGIMVEDTPAGPRWTVDDGR